MSDEAITTLLGEGPFAFVGTIEHMGAATMTDVPIDSRTAVVRVDHVLQAPEALPTLEGQRITMQLKEDTQPGEQAAFFAQGLAFGESVAVTEVGRVAVEAVEPHVTRGCRGRRPARRFAALQRAGRGRAPARARRRRGRGRGRHGWSGSRTSSSRSSSEHDPDWWRATIDVSHVEKGDVQTGPLRGAVRQQPRRAVARGRRSRRPRRSGLWILHATAGRPARGGAVRDPPPGGLPARAEPRRPPGGVSLSHGHGPASST